MSKTQTIPSTSHDTTIEFPSNTFTQNLDLTIEIKTPNQINLRKTVIIHESSWDDGIPFHLPNYPHYRVYSERNLELFHDDNTVKQDRFTHYLQEGDLITISSNRVWDSVTKLPKIYPITTTYYHNLMGCPELMSVSECYRQATPGKFQGRLGYTLIKTFENPFAWGNLFSISDQSAEEAFTVYDHPKVFIFQKNR